MKYSVNSPCPCGSKKKYKKCCKIFHNGINPKNALELMKSRYSAYATNNPEYIINTTHKLNNEYVEQKWLWEENIKQFIKDTQFNSLDILEFIDGEDEAYVTFKANIAINEKDSSFIEKSKFLKVENKWLYLNGEISQ